jgi:transcriptional regulator
MYVPHFNRLEDPDAVRAMVHGVGSAHLVSVGDDGYPVATRLPVIWDEPGGRLVFHLAKANPHWRSIPEAGDGPAGPGAGVPALAVVSDVEAYISPSWYASKGEHGRVVPTWNYSAVEFTGRARRHSDPGWLLAAVTALTDLHEQPRPDPWSVADAPAPYIEKQLNAIVGVELEIERVTAKAKLSQNRSAADRSGAVEGLRATGASRDAAMAGQMQDSLEKDPGEVSIPGR